MNKNVIQLEGGPPEVATTDWLCKDLLYQSLPHWHARARKHLTRRERGAKATVGYIPFNRFKGYRCWHRNLVDEFLRATFEGWHIHTIRSSDSPTCVQFDYDGSPE